MIIFCSSGDSSEVSRPRTQKIKGEFMKIDKAQKIHDLMEELYQVEKFLKDLNCNNIEPEIWLRATDGSVHGVASNKPGGDYYIEGFKACVREHLEARRDRYLGYIEKM